MKVSQFVGLGCMTLMFGARQAKAVIFLDSGDPTVRSSSPGDNSGWQYEGKFIGFLGVPIGPNHFITAKHIGGSIGDTFDFHGDIYTTVGFQDVGTTDLRVWEINNSKPFRTYAPISTGVTDIGATATLIGRGTQRGEAVSVMGEAKGWKWGPGDGVQRWGRNAVTSSVNGGGLGQLLTCEFNNPGVEAECHLSTGDSGGGMFVLEAGLWRLAGINYAVDGPYRTGPADPGFHASLFDTGGLEISSGGGWVAVAEQALDVPSKFYSSRISSSATALAAITPAVNSLAPENFNAWLSLYFSPSEIAASTTAASGDYDGDGISNLLEFALNLDPAFPRRPIMTVGTGLSGLPVARVVFSKGADRLTLECVRRTAGSGSGLTYTAQFSNDLVSWDVSGTETVTAINPRWERVRFNDAAAVSNNAKRFGRVIVTATP